MATQWGRLGKFVKCYQGNYIFCSEILLIRLVLETAFIWYSLLSSNNEFQNNNGLLDWNKFENTNVNLSFISLLTRFWL